MTHARTALGVALLGAALGSIVLASCSSDTSGPSSPSSSETGEPIDPSPSPSPPIVAPPRFRMAGGLLPGVKHRRTDDAPRGTATPQCKNPKLSYFDGPIIQTPVIVPVFWSTDVNPELVANMPQFFADVTESAYWSWLWEYNSLGLAGGTGQVILPGTATAGVTLVPSKCKAGTGTCNLQDTDIQNELSAQINAGKLPAPVLDCTGNVETVYMIEFPPLITVTGADVGTSCVNNGFCAYHNTGTYGASTPLVYGVLMDQYSPQSGCSTGCGDNATNLENSTDTASHELAEAVTDPDIGLDTQTPYADPAAWGDNNNNCGEIADICDANVAGDTITVSGRTWVVQELWSNAQKKCTSTGPAKTCPAPDNCGTVPYGCTTLSCGTCTASETCNANVCSSCTPITSCPAGDNCGTVPDGCGGMLSCGACTAPQTCGGAGTPNQCGCTPLATCPASDTCGTLSNGCGGLLLCGTCGANQVCTNNQCVSGSSSSSSSSTSSSSSSSSTSSSTSSSSSTSTSSSSTSSTSSGMTSTSSSSTSSSSSSGAGGAGSTTSSSSTSSSSGAGGAGGAGSTSSGFGVGGFGGSGSTSSSGSSTGAGAAEAGSSSGLPGSTGGCSCKTAGDPLESSGTPLSAFAVLALAGVVRSRKRRHA